MEISEQLKSLYKHWGKHVEPAQSASPHANIDEKLLHEIATFITERMRIWERKISGIQPPFTSDKILAKYRFCNIYRELDRQTIQIHTMLTDISNDFELWLLNLLYLRFVCRPDTVADTGFLSYGDNSKVLKKLISHPRPKYGTAYIFPISAIYKSGYTTREHFFCSYLPKVTRKLAAEIDLMNNCTVNEALERLLPILGVNMRFHMTEVLIDVAYQFPEKLDLFKDFHVGPGALPTLQRLSAQFSPTELLNSLSQFRIEGFPYLTYNGKEIPLSAENWEGIACEFRKYSNLKAGRGRKRVYR